MVGMLFSDWQATTQALQPVQDDRFTARPQACWSYLYPGYMLIVGTSSTLRANSGSLRYYSNVPVRTRWRPSMLKWCCVEASSKVAPAFCTEAVASQRPA